MMRRLLTMVLLLCVLLSNIALAQVTDPAANEVGISPIVKEGEDITITIGLEQNVNVTDYYDNHLTKMIEERTGVKLEFVLFPSTDASAKLDLMVAAGEKLPDIIHVGVGSTARVLNYANAGAIIPVEKYYETLGEPLRLRAEAVGKDYDSILEQLRLPDGHIYAANFLLDNNYNNYHAQRAWINQAWLDKLGLETPTNYEELYNVLVAFRDGDPNGNGDADEIPMMGCTNGWCSDAVKYLQNMFIYANCNNTCFLPFSETDGKLDVSYDKDEYREALKYTNKLVADGLLSTLSFTQDGTQFNTFMRASPAQVGVFVVGGAEPLFDGECAAQYVPFEVCAGPQGVQWQTLYTSSPGTCAVISADCEHPEIAFLYLHYVYYCYLEDSMDSYDIYYTAAYGKQGENWDYAKEGSMSVYDVPASLNVIKNITGTPSNNTWARFDVFVNIVNPLDLLQESDGRTDTFLYNAAKNFKLNSVHAPAESDLPGKLNYSLEETEIWNDTRTALTIYVDECRTLFTIGEMDPNNDADWESYLKELNNLQYKELLAVDQMVYDRMYAKD